MFSSGPLHTRRRAALVAVAIGACALLSAPTAIAQIRMGGIRGVVEDPAGARVAGQMVEVADPATGQRWRVSTDTQGAFAVGPLPYGRYRLTVLPAAGFRGVDVEAVVESNLPTVIDLRLLMVAFDDAQVVRAGLEPMPLTTRSEHRVNGGMAVLPAQRAISLAGLIASGPGMARGHNALIHVRGVEDGVLYVVDGVPVTERYDLLHASAFDVDAVDAITVITGNLPAEFGGRSGAVVSIDRSSGRPASGYARIGGGSLSSVDASAGGGVWLGALHVSGSAAASASDRFLDPVDEGNLNNHGERYVGGVRGLWRTSPSGKISFGAFGAATRLDVPNDAEQQQAGQRQVQSLDDESLSVAWQQTPSPRIVTDVAAYHRRYHSELLGSPWDVPIAARSDRTHARTGALGSVTAQYRRHLIKAGGEASRITPDEHFAFAITDEEMARERDVSEPALAFDTDNPFVFVGRRVGSYAAAFVQDEIAVGSHVRVDAGLRFDRTTLPRPATQWSPRLGVAVSLPASGGTARASFNRLFMPPHIEHLLLANSEEARLLSPFADDTHTGGADVRPERVTAFEVGLAQPLGRRVALDVAYWDRQFEDVSDPNVFFNTTIVFPNSVASGRARGLDVSLTLREQRGVSGFVNYTHSRVHNVGPITGGLFLTDEFIEIGPGTVFEPDHDQPHIASAGLRLQPSTRWWVSMEARHGGGGPLEVDEDDIEEVAAGPGGDLIDVGRGRMKPWTLVDMAASADLVRGRVGQLALRVDVQNLLGSRFAYTVGNPFEGTRFGHPRLVRVGLEWRWPQ